MTRLSKILLNVSQASYYLILLLVPVFFLPFTVDFLEFNKQYLLYALVFISLLSWIGAAVSERKFEFRRTPLDLPLLALWVLALASSLASKDRYLSFLGNFEILNLGFASITFYIFLYFLTTNVVTGAGRAKTAIRFLVISALLSVVYFFLQQLGILARIGVRLPLLNLTSILATQLGFFVLSALVIALNSLFLPRKSRVADILWLLVFAISLGTVIAIGFKSIWIVAAVGLFFLLVFAIARLEELRTPWISVGFSVFVLSLLFTLLGTPRFLTLRLPLEVSLSNAVTWKVTTHALGESVLRFVLGSGPASFSYSFSQYRPEALNTSFVWATRFTQGSSTFLDMLGSLGFLGTAAYMVVVLLALGTVLYLWMKRPSRGVKKLEFGGNGEGALISVSTTLWLMLLLVSFVATLGTALWMLFIVMLGITMTLSRSILAPEAKPWSLSLKTSPQYSLASSFGFILLFSGIVVLGAFFGRFYAANVAYAKSLRQINQGNYEQAIKESARAVNLHPTNTSYHLALAQSYLLQAALEAGKGQPNAGLVTNLLAFAVNEARRATNLAPSSVAAWESLATMYANARGVAPDANDWVIRSLNRAIELEGTNPVHYLRRGGAKLAAGDFDGAKKDYEQSIRLKPDYVDAYISLAFAEEQKGDLDAALVHMVDGLRFAQQNPDVMFQVGRIAYNRNKEGDLQLAEQAFLGAVQVNPNHANALFSLGLVYERLDRPGDALRYYRKVQQLNPQNQDVRRKIESLQAPASTE